MHLDTEIFYCIFNCNNLETSSLLEAVKFYEFNYKTLLPVTLGPERSKIDDELFMYKFLSIIKCATELKV